MDEYQVTLARSTRKELEVLPIETARRILARLEALARNPRPENCVKLRGQSNLWRIRVGDYRVIYSVSDAERLVDVCYVRHRREAIVIFKQP